MESMGSALVDIFSRSWRIYAVAVVHIFVRNGGEADTCLIQLHVASLWRGSALKKLQVQLILGVRYHSELVICRYVSLFL
ncbi:hypothetical protein D3C81_956380 [compost metagenome]